MTEPFGIATITTQIGDGTSHPGRPVAVQSRCPAWQHGPGTSTARGARVLISIGADHAGFTLKESVKAHLTAAGHTLADVGAYSEESVDFETHDHCNCTAEPAFD